MSLELSSSIDLERFPKNNIIKLSRNNIITLLKNKYGITSNNTSYIINNISIIDNLLSRLDCYKKNIISKSIKEEISNYYASMLQDYLKEYRDEGRELSIDYTDMNIVRRILLKNNINIPNKEEQQKIFTINALVKEIIN